MSITALALTIWANGAVTEQWGESPNPLTVTGHAAQLADKLVAAGVEAAAARASIYRQCRISKKDRPPSSVNYFANGIEEDWQRELARRAFQSSGERPPPRESDSIDAELERWKRETDAREARERQPT